MLDSLLCPARVSASSTPSWSWRRPQKPVIIAAIVAYGEAFLPIALFSQVICWPCNLIAPWQLYTTHVCTGCVLCVCVWLCVIVTAAVDAPQVGHGSGMSTGKLCPRTADNEGSSRSPRLLLALCATPCSLGRCQWLVKASHLQGDSFECSNYERLR